MYAKRLESLFSVFVDVLYLMLSLKQEVGREEEKRKKINFNQAITRTQTKTEKGKWPKATIAQDEGISRYERTLTGTVF